MTYRDQFRAIVLLTSGMLLGCLVAALPTETRSRIHHQLQDFIRPAVRTSEQIPVAKWRAQLLPDRTQTTAASPENNSGTPAQTEAISRLEREILALNDQLSRQQSLASQAGERLFLPRLISARRLQGRQLADWRSGTLLDIGSDVQVREEDWVLLSEKPMLDVGADLQIHADDLILSGRGIIGQVEAVGRWTSLFRFVTDEKFRCAAQVQKLDRRDQASNVGSFHGLGENHCSLRYIENTVPISVGDYVVLADPDGVWKSPLILGTVTRAEIAVNSPFWEIDVAPLIDPDKIDEVLVLSEQISPRRIAAGRTDSPASGTRN